MENIILSENKNKPLLDSSFPEKYQKIAEFLDDDMAFLETLPKGVDPNMIILQKMKKSTIVFPLTFIVARKPHTFQILDKARRFIMEKYKIDLFPLLIDSIRKYGMEPKPEQGKNPPYGLHIQFLKPSFPDTPKTSYASIYYKSYEIEELTNYILSMPLLVSLMKRGDLIENLEDDQLYIWDGKQVKDLDSDEAEWGSVPSEFRTLTEFPFGYFFGDDNTDHPFFGMRGQWMDLSSYGEQAEENFDEEEQDSFIDVDEVVNGEKRKIRIYLNPHSMHVDSPKPTGKDFKDYITTHQLFFASFDPEIREISIPIE